MSTAGTGRQQQLFVRKSTGLVREASAFDAMVFNAVFSAPVGATLAWGVFIALSLFPGADLVTATLIAFAINVPQSSPSTIRGLMRYRTPSASR